MIPAVLVITGASGAGKTAAAQAIRALGLPDVDVHGFDSIGVPAPERMTADWGSPEGWQRAMTMEWIRRLAAAPAERLQVLDAQVRPQWVVEAFRSHGVTRGLVVLLDCAAHVRHRRLVRGRGQPELVSPAMDAWAAYLRGQADALENPVVDGTALTPEAVANEILTVARRSGLLA